MALQFLSPFSILFGTVSTAAVIATWGVLGRNWSRLPATVPHHFDFSGRPDAFGDKSILWIIPVLSTVIHAMLVVVGWLIAARVEPLASMRANVDMISATMTFNAGLMFAVVHAMIDVGLGRRDSLGRWFLPATLAASALLIGFGLLRLR